MKTVTKTLWVDGDVESFVLTGTGEINLRVTGGASLALEDIAYTKKPTKKEATDDGEYPKSWPLKQIRITIEEV